MSQYIDLDLDRLRRFKLTPSDWRDSARRASALYGTPISTTRLLVLVGESDDTALACVLSMGCRHQDAKASTDKMLDVIDARRRDGRGLDDVGDAILDQLRTIGVLRPEKDEPAEENPTPVESSSSTPSDG